MNYALVTLQNALADVVSELRHGSSVTEKSQLITRKNQLTEAVKLLEQCQQYGVTSAATFTTLPAKRCDTPSCDYRIIEDGESDNPAQWYELVLSDKPFNHLRLTQGDVVIER